MQEAFQSRIRYTGNEDYRSFHVHVMQNAVKACCEAWKGYFEALKAFSPSSGSTGRPRIPGYKKPGGRSTAVFSNIACSIKHGVLFFPCYREDGPSGRKRKRCSIPVAEEEETVQHPCRGPPARVGGQTGRSTGRPLFRPLPAAGRHGRRAFGRGSDPG